MWNEAISTLQEGARLSGGYPLLLGSLGWSLARAGRADEARGLLAELDQRSRAGYVAPTALAAIHLGLGEMHQAFEWLDKAIDLRDPVIVPIKSFPHLDPLRPNPRFRALLRKMNLEA